MSSHCRHFGTRIMTGGHRLLIVKDTATVAEGRQEQVRVTLRNNKKKRKKAHAVCKCGSKNTLFDAQDFRAMEPRPLFSRVRGEAPRSVHSFTLLTVVLLRHYIAAIASPIISVDSLCFESNTPPKLIAVCDCVNGMSAGSHRTLPK